MTNTQKLGIKGEDIATKHLEHKGYTILKRNWRHGKKEIDIIAKKDDKLIIIEVKSRSTSIHENPFDAVGKKKQRHIIDAAEGYIIENDINMETRFDIISIVTNNGKTEIEHIEDAFYPIAK